MLGPFTAPKKTFNVLRCSFARSCRLLMQVKSSPLAASTSLKKLVSGLEKQLFSSSEKLVSGLKMQLFSSAKHRGLRWWRRGRGSWHVAKPRLNRQAETKLVFQT